MVRLGTLAQLTTWQLVGSTRVGYAQFAQLMIKDSPAVPPSVAPCSAHDSCLSESYPIVRGNCLRITFEFAGLIGGELVCIHGSGERRSAC